MANLWHNRFCHASLQLIDKLHRQNLVRGLPKIDPNKYEIYEACVKGKQVRSSFKSKKEVSSSKPLELIHMDLCGPMQVRSRGGKNTFLLLLMTFHGTLGLFSCLQRTRYSKNSMHG